jgi:catechol 2,3-dioxygenase-like lactoylglutathione lyase family enzyme
MGRADRRGAIIHVVRHLALPVTDQERSRRFYESYFGFDARPPRIYDGDVLMLYNADGFSLALGQAEGPIHVPSFLHFGLRAGSPDEVRAWSSPRRRDSVRSSSSRSRTT